MNKYNLYDVLAGTIVTEVSDKEKTFNLSGIQIPMIQRDYAQGRKEEKEIRRRLLKTMFDALCSGEELELDLYMARFPQLMANNILFRWMASFFLLGQCLAC